MCGYTTLGSAGKCCHGLKSAVAKRRVSVEDRGESETLACSSSTRCVNKETRFVLTAAFTCKATPAQLRVLCFL